MEDVCVCMVKETETVHSIGVNNNEGKYYSEEAGGCFDLKRNTHIFQYLEMSWYDLRSMIEIKHQVKDTVDSGGIMPCVDGIDFEDSRH